MRVSNKRDELRLLNQQRNELGVRFQLRINTKPNTQSPFASPYASNVESSDPATDTVVNGKAVFQEQKEDQEARGVGSVIVRKGYLDVHPTYEESFRKAYTVTVGGTTGQWEVVDVSDSVGQIQLRITLQSRQ